MSDFSDFRISAISRWQPPEPEDIVAQMERFAALLPDKAVKLVSRIDCGPAGYNAIQRAASSAERFSTLRNSIPGGVPVHVLDRSTWPPNLIVAIDREGNAMKAWIVND